MDTAAMVWISHYLKVNSAGGRPALLQLGPTFPSTTKWLLQSAGDNKSWIHGVGARPFQSHAEPKP